MRLHSVRSPMLLVLLLALAVIALNGCADNPLKIAQTNEQRGYATLGQYVIVEEQAAEFICGAATATDICPGNPAVPDNVRAKVKSADAAAAPVVKSLTEILKTLAGIMAQLNQCSSSPDPAECKVTAQDRLRVANANLIGWINQLLPLVAQLKSTVGR